MLDEKFLSILACPKCKGELAYRPEHQRLICPACRLQYPIQDDIPILLVEKGEPLPQG
jgi:hypothetical protein